MAPASQRPRPGAGEDLALIQRHLFALRLALLVADAIVAALVFLVVRAVRYGEADPSLWTALNVDLTVGVALYAAAWVTTLWFLGLYELRVRWTIGRETNDILVATFMVAFATMSFLYLVQVNVSRLFLLLLLIAQPLATTAERLVVRLGFNQLRARGYNRNYMVVIGTGQDAQAFADAVERHRELGIQVMGHLWEPNPPMAVTRPILGDVADLQRIFHEHVVDEIAICVRNQDADWVTPLIRLAADEGKHVRVPTPVAASVLDRQSEELDGLLIRSYVHGPARILSLAAKRAIDIVCATMGLLVTSPVLLGVSIVILASDGRPILFRQTRVGLHGRPFVMHKFRTMEPDAEARLGELIALSDTKGPAFTMRDDPRVTRLGAFLRRSSIDELPQLWNVLKGEMSLIGPRPAPPREVADYDVWHRRRLSMRPGITGLSQIRTRVDAHFDQRAELDLAYIDGWSLVTDLWIVLRTVPAVIGRRGW